MKCKREVIKADIGEASIRQKEFEKLCLFNFKINTIL